MRFLWQESSSTDRARSCAEIFLEAEGIDAYTPLRDLPVEKAAAAHEWLRRQMVSATQ